MVLGLHERGGGNLAQGSGNDVDQATLLVALLRAAGFPARYVRGVVEFPDIEKAKNVTGVTDARYLSSFFRRRGSPTNRW